MSACISTHAQTVKSYCLYHTVGEIHESSESRVWRPRHTEKPPSWREVAMQRIDGRSNEIANERWKMKHCYAIWNFWWVDFRNLPQSFSMTAPSRKDPSFFNPQCTFGAIYGEANSWSVARIHGEANGGKHMRKGGILNRHVRTHFAQLNWIIKLSQSKCLQKQKADIKSAFCFFLK